MPKHETRLSPTTQEVPAIVRAATVLPESVDAEARTVDVVFTSGSAVRRFDWFEGEFDEVLEVSEEAIRSERLNAGISILNSHRSYDLKDVLGITVAGSFKITGRGKKRQGHTKIRFAKDDEQAERIFNLVSQGIVRSVSVGYLIHEARKETPTKAGERPVLRVVDWEPIEISFVPVPADPSAAVRSGVHSRATIQGIEVMADENTETEERSENTGAENTGAEQRSENTGTDLAAIRAESEAAGAARVRTEISQIADYVTLGGGTARDLAGFIAEGKKPDEVRKIMLEKRDAKIRNDQETRSQNGAGADGDYQAGGLASRMVEKHGKKEA